MYKSLLFVGLGLVYLLPSTLLAQCEISTATAVLDVNNVRADLNLGAGLWETSPNGVYFVPGENNISSIYSASLWVAGKDSNGDIKINAYTYGPNGSVAGPLNEDGSLNEDNCTNFDKIWSVTGSEIAGHVADFEADGVVDGPIPESVLAWPGLGNPHSLATNGFDLPFNPQGLAPFVDVNLNGLYDPEGGDYPDICGAGKAFWWIYNTASSTGDNPLKLEISVLAYASESSDPAIDNTTYYKYKIVNRSSENFDDTYLAFWVDPDLGCFGDDYVGCSPERNMAYFYNRGNVDGEGISSCNPANSFGENIPMLGVQLVKGPSAPKVIGPNGELTDPVGNEIGDTLIQLGMSKFMPYFNGGTNPPPPSGTDDPGSLQEFYNYLSGNWRDGTPLTSGGIGYDPNSTDFTDFAFPDNPADPDGWSMCNAVPSPVDPRMLITSGPFRLQPGVVNRITYMITAVEDVPHPCPDVTILEDAMDIALNNICVPVEPIPTSIFDLNSATNRVIIQPNPLAISTELSLQDASQSIKSVSLYSIDGKILRHYDAVNTSSLTIERGDLPSGMLIYQVTTRNAQVYTGKLIVQ